MIDMSAAFETSGAPFPTRDASPAYLWTFPGCPLNIHLALSVVSLVRSYLVDAGEHEVGGLLLGEAQGGNVHIRGYAPWPANGPLPHESALKRYIADVDTHQPLAVVGYFRTDSREGVRLNEADLRVITQLFRDRSNVFLIVSPRTSPPMAGFFFWDGDTVFGEMSFMEFAFDERELEQSGINHVEPTVPPSAPIEVATPVPEPSPREHRVLMRVLFATATLVGISGAAFSIAPIVQRRIAAWQDPAAVQLSLSGVRHGRQIVIQWNGGSAAVQQAGNATVTIIDGSVRRNIRLTREQLSAISSLVYIAQNERVDIRLEVFRGDTVAAHQELTLPPGT